MNKFETAKHELDGLDVYDRLMEATQRGLDRLDADDLFRLKWYGLYQHNTKDDNFMLRVKVVQGILSADQAEELARITHEFGRDVIDCTTRQCVQIHWIQLANVPEVFERLEKVGLTTSGACGDITRNIVGNTLAGIADDEVVDGAATAEAIHEFFLDNKLYSNLPRKYKISINGRPTNQGRGMINCLSLVGAVHADGTKGFNIRVGGGLSSAPRMARDIDVFADPEETPEIVAAITSVFRDSEENRSKRGKARLKFLVDALGPDGFREKVVEELGRDPRRAAPSLPDVDYHDHVGVIPQADGEHTCIGFTVPVGRLSADQLHEFVRLSREHTEKHEVRLTHQQNVLLPWVPNANVQDVLAEELATTLPVQPSQFVRNTQTCTGKEYCGLAKVHTKGRVEGLIERLDERVGVDLGDDFRFHFAGCSSSCAQQQIGDVGIEGVLKRYEGEMVEAHDIRLGGHVNDPETARFNEPVLKKVRLPELEDALVTIFDVYAQERESEQETFRAFTKRVGLDWWRARLEPVEAAA